MARRNGKTYVTSGTVVALLLAVPGIKVAIFSTCKRTSGMMMQAIDDMLRKAMDIGTHCNDQDFQTVSKNMESIVMVGPDGTKRIVGCFPGSVRVSNISFLCFFSCAGMCVYTKENQVSFTFFSKIINFCFACSFSGSSCCTFSLARFLCTSSKLLPAFITSGLDGI